MYYIEIIHINLQWILNLSLLIYLNKICFQKFQNHRSSINLKNSK